MAHEYIVVAHRGGKGNGFENSIEAIEKSIAQRPDMIEIDIRMTRDHEFVVFHDAILDRLTNWSGFVNTKTLKTLQKVRLKDGSRMPMLDDVFRLVKKNPSTRLILDIKDLSTGIFDYVKLIKKIRRYGLAESVIILCINYHLLRRIARDYPELTYCYFGLLPQRKVLVRAKKIGAAYVGALMLTKQFIAKAHQRRMKVVSLGTERIKKLQWYIRNNVDVISSGSPVELRELIGQHLTKKECQTFMGRFAEWIMKKLKRDRA